MPGAFNKDMSEQRKDVTVEDLWKVKIIYKLKCSFMFFTGF